MTAIALRDLLVEQGPNVVRVTHKPTGRFFETQRPSDLDLARTIDMLTESLRLHLGLDPVPVVEVPLSGPPTIRYGAHGRFEAVPGPTLAVLRLHPDGTVTWREP